MALIRNINIIVKRDVTDQACSGLYSHVVLIENTIVSLFPRVLPLLPRVLPIFPRVLPLLLSLQVLPELTPAIKGIITTCDLELITRCLSTLLGLYSGSAAGPSPVVKIAASEVGQG